VLACDHKVAALPPIALTGDSQYPLAVLVKLGLDYLPARLYSREFALGGVRRQGGRMGGSDGPRSGLSGCWH